MEKSTLLPLLGRERHHHQRVWELIVIYFEPLRLRTEEERLPREASR